MISKTKLIIVMVAAFVLLLPAFLWADLTSGLVAYWSFDNCDAIDDSENGHNGTPYGNPQCVNGEKGKGYSFDGQDDFISIPSDSHLDNMDFTISMWFNQAGPGKDGGGTFIDRLLKGSTNQDTRWDSLGLFTFDGSQPYLFYNWDGDENNCCDGKYFPFSPSILNNT
jgi:hypothetical protein